jgi:radical SAM superfamily enzyme YgiQ (UPF0313 family)
MAEIAMPLEEPVFRPPAEADNVIIQVSRGCPHNGCLFCGMYKGVRYREESLEEIRGQIADAAAEAPDAMRAFLADGDAMRLPFERLEEILRLLKEAFPRLARVSSYANGSSIAAKTEAELAKLKSLGLSTLYIGLESGDDAILKLMRKGESARGMVDAALKARSQGLKISTMVLLGIGGRKLSARHVEATADALNRMNPELLSFLKMVRLPGLPLYEGFEEQSEHGAILELRQIVALLNLNGTVLRANHSSIPYPIGGRLPKDKDKLTQLLDRLLNSYMLDRNGPGREPLAL